jgi:hypothetical protein
MRDLFAGLTRDPTRGSVGSLVVLESLRRRDYVPAETPCVRESALGCDY